MRLPKHATVISYLALSVAMGGTAYAVTGGNFVLGHANKANQSTALTNTGAGPALKLATKKRSTPPFAVSNGTKISNLNADKVDGLHASAFQPKSHRIYFSTTSGTGDHVAGKAGPWTFTLTCAGGGPASLVVTGPGTIASTTSLAAGSSAATTFVGKSGPIGAGAVSSVGDNAQMSQTEFLKSGSTIMKVQWHMTASPGLFESCDVIGDAVAVPA